MDKFTLITGASTGIGKALAHISAENGRDLVLLARSQDKLETLGKALQEEHGVRVEIIVQDLAASNSAERTRSEVGGRGLEIGTLITMPASEISGPFTRPSSTCSSPCSA